MNKQKVLHRVLQWVLQQVHLQAERGATPPISEMQTPGSTKVKLRAQAAKGVAV